MQVLSATILLLVAVAASQNVQPYQSLSRTTKRKIAPQESPPPCGIRKIRTRPLIVEAANALAGEWPWHAAVYHVRDGGRLKEYKCGGTLIERDFVLTTASCARYGLKKPEGAIVVELGQHNLVESSSRAVSVPVSKVFVHDEAASSGDRRNDVALLRLKNAIEYNDYIQPACLPKAGEQIEQYDEKLGTIVGWGYQQAGKLSDELRSARVPVVPYIECLQSDVDFFAQEIHAGMYCAGWRNGTAPCFGDAGGGMFFQGRNRAWTLRGMISFTHVVYTVTGGCNTEHFFGATNVVEYLPWINETINGDRGGGDRVNAASSEGQKHTVL